MEGATCSVGGATAAAGVAAGAAAGAAAAGACGAKATSGAAAGAGPCGGVGGAAAEPAGVVPSSSELANSCAIISLLSSESQLSSALSAAEGAVASGAFIAFRTNSCAAACCS